MERLFIREVQKEREPKRGKVNIGVAGLGQDVGTSLIATSLAFYFEEKGNSVTFSQCTTPSQCKKLIYNSVGMDKRFTNRTFKDVYSIIHGKEPMKDTVNMEEGINWVLATPENIKNKIQLAQDEKARLIGNGKSEICIYDLELSNGWEIFLMDMDSVIMVVDPLPSKLMGSLESFRVVKAFEASGGHVTWIVNKYNPGVNLRQVKGFLKISRLLTVPMFDESIIYANEFSCKFHWKNGEIKSNLLEVFTKVSH